uniref:Uncharacterized protein n=1 Tax=Lutzomyia longipalpis TaxID=7200 RepID=A0A1B0CRA6_LUTLO
MTRTWNIFCVALFAFPIVLGDGGGGHIESNATIPHDSPVQGKTGFVSVEGGSIPTNWTQKSVKKELGEMPKLTNTTTAENKSSDIPGNITSTVIPAVPALPRPEPKNITLPVVSGNGTNSTKSTPEAPHPDKGNKTESSVKLPTNSTTEAPKISSTTSSTTTTTSTMTTTTARPKKPHLTVSVEDDPSLLDVPAKSPKHPPSSDSGRLDVEEPVAQLSQENILEMPVNHRDYIVPIVVLIFAIPMVLGLATVVVRRFRDFWLTRHYRRMDYLVDGMYND